MPICRWLGLIAAAYGPGWAPLAGELGRDLVSLHDPSVALRDISGRRPEPAPIVSEQGNRVAGPGIITVAFTRGCCTKPARKSSSALAEVHVRAAVRDDVGTDRPLATTGMAVFGAHP